MTVNVTTPFGRIRSAIEADLPEIVEMIHALAVHHGDQAHLTTEILAEELFGAHPLITILVAEQSGTLIGYAGLIPRIRLHHAQRIMDLHHLYVREDKRGMGVGGALVEESAQYAKSIGCGFMIVGSDPRNSHAQEFYRSMNFDEPRMRAWFKAYGSEIRPCLPLIFR